MSVCVEIRTKTIPAPETLLNHLAEKGERIMVTSNEYPTVKFGNYQEAIRGVEVNKEEYGLEVRICSFSSTEDYQLFAKTVNALMELTGGRAYLEGDEEITDSLKTFDKEWIQARQNADFNVVYAFAANGQNVVMYGLFCKFCLGPKFLASFDIQPGHKFQQEDVKNLFAYLCKMQWYCANLTDTAMRMVLRAPSGESDSELTVSAIMVKDGKVAEFDYISEASVFSILDLDDENSAPAIIPFQQAWKILPGKAFTPLDELQYRRTAELTVEDVHEMMRRSRHLQPDDLHDKPTYPGSGFDSAQHTFILMWNPDTSEVTLEDHIASIENMFTEYFRRSVWQHDKAKCGDRFYVVRAGEGKTGIVMSGVFDSQPYESEELDDLGQHIYYMDMHPNVILDPESAPMITTEELHRAIPSFDWTGGHSGRMLSQQEAQKLETVWSKFLRNNRNFTDIKTFNINNFITFR